MQSAIPEFALGQKQRLGLRDLETAKLVATSLAVRVGVVLVYSEDYGLWRVFEDGKPETVLTLSELLMRVFAAVDEAVPA